VPFDALWSPASSRYLIEDHPLATAPGLRVLARALAQAPVAGRDKPPSVLAIGLSDFDRDRFPILDPLPEAEPEAEAVAAHYPLSKTLIGGRATSSEILAALPHYPIVHFATHVLSLPGLEPTSSLVVAPGATSDGLLDLAALGRMNLIQLRLAVLSGCRSVTTFARGREGIDGVARPFLAAGVPAVVASLWDVDDRSSKRFWSALHRLLACGVPLAEAMRTAKVEWIRSLEPAFRSPANWAVFQVLGNPEVAVSFDRTRRERCLTSSK
jgi:CHAT domain-containing protein